MIPSREIAKHLRERFPGIIFTTRQLKKLRHRLKKATHKGYTPFQATMALLDTRGITYEVKWEDPDTKTKPTGLFWSPSWSGEEWRLHPWI
ncbi:hypothetical protein B0H67DRAFT_571132 [Lasiosphaeris hirsuta]|uniref:Uncharacterized protein n=1 Tax=Lasiosphaeris hirsuta TaxID=260670 RepID=A0AA40B0Z4_9PEZI|nr:hypothetical protein B0H67DRAFT_571132 [Lasiosphaeris hirsuta]